MSWISKFYNAIKSFNRVSHLQNPMWNVFWGTPPVITAPDKIKQVQDGYLLNPDVYSVINLITDTASRVPWIMYKVKDRKALRNYKMYNPLSVKSRALRSKSLDEIDGHPLLDRLMEPNPLQGQYECIQQLLGFKLITGDTYLLSLSPDNGPNAGQPVGLVVLPAQYTHIIPGEGGDIQAYRINIGGGNIKSYPADKVMHLKTWTPKYGTAGEQFYGLSPLEAAFRAVRLGNDTYLGALEQQRNTGAKGLLTPDFGVNDQILQQKFNKEQADQIRAEIDKRINNVNERGKVAGLSTPMKWQQIGMNAQQLETIAMLKWNREAICNIYKVPPVLLDPSNSSYANMNEAEKALYTRVVVPELSALRDKLNQWLVPKYGTDLYLDFDVSGIEVLQEDMKEKVDVLERAWWLKPNDRLEQMGFERDPDPAMEQRYIPANLIPLTGDLQARATRQIEDSLNP